MKKTFLIIASLLMILIGLLRGLGALLLAINGNEIQTGVPIIASSTQTIIVSAGLAFVCLIFIFAGIRLIASRSKQSWNLSWLGIILFLIGGIVNGFILFGHPLGSGQLINISVSILIGLFLTLGKDSLKERIN